MHTYTALFDQQSDAETAQAELLKLGIVPEDTVNVAGKDSRGFAAERDADNRSFWDSLKGVFVSHEDRPTYEEGIRQGGWLLTVNVDDQNARRVRELLDRSRAVNVDEREAQYRAAGTLPAAKSVSEQTIPVVEEQLTVGKRVVEQGGVRVRAYVVSKPVQADVNLRQERVEVERHAVDRPASAGEVADAMKERSVEVKTHKEEAVVAKEARVVEEISVGKEMDERVEKVGGVVRRTEVEVERVGSDGKVQPKKS